METTIPAVGTYLDGETTIPAAGTYLVPSMLSGCYKRCVCRQRRAEREKRAAAGGGDGSFLRVLGLDRTLFFYIQ